MLRKGCGKNVPFVSGSPLGNVSRVNVEREIKETAIRKNLKMKSVQYHIEKYTEML